MPGSAAVQVSVPISAFASGYKNSAFIADQICPIIHTDFAKGTYFTYLKSDTADVVDDLIGEETAAPTIDYTNGQTSFVVLDRGYKGYVSYKAIDNAQDPLKPRETRAARIMQRLLLAQEVRVATMLQTTSNYAAANTSAAAAKWTDEVNGSPVKDVQLMVASVAPGDPGMTKLVLALGLEAWQAMSRHPQILGLRPGGGTAGGVLKTAEVADYLGIDEILVCDVIKTTSARGLAAKTFGRVWDTTKAVLSRIPKAAQPTMEDELSIHSCMFRYASKNQTPLVAVEWDDPDRGGGKGSVVIKITHSTVEGIVQSDMGYCLTTIT